MDMVCKISLLFHLLEGFHEMPGLRVARRWGDAHAATPRAATGNAGTTTRAGAARAEPQPQPQAVAEKEKKMPARDTANARVNL